MELVLEDVAGEGGTGWTEQPTQTKLGSRRVLGLREQMQKVCAEGGPGEVAVGELASCSLELEPNL